MSKNKKIFKSASTYSSNKSFRINKGKLIAAAAVFIAVLVGSYFLYMNTGYQEANAEALLANGKFAKGVKVQGTDIGGLTYNEALQTLDPVEFQKAENFDLTIVLDSKKYNIDGDDINVDTNLEDVLKQAITVGQTGDRGERKKILSQVKNEGQNFLLRYVYDSDLMDQQLADIQSKSGNSAQDATVKIEGGEIIYIEGKVGIKIDKDQLAADMSAGMDQGQEQFVIQAKTVEVSPSITVASLKERLAKKATTTTEFKTSTASRVNNVVKAAGLLNGEMISPGKTFSINAVLGARTQANGWSLATAISSGKYIDDVGGGVCQVSSTLYNAAVKAGLEVVERRHHSYPVSYLPTGQDAAISTGGPDLKLRNNYDFPIYIVAYASSSSKTLDVMIYGPRNEDNGAYVFKSEEISNEQPSEKASVTVNGNLFKGEYVEIKPRKNRIEVERWREYVIDGKVVRTEKMSNDTYAASVGEYAIGEGTEIDGSTGKPKGKKVSEDYLNTKRTTTEATTTTQATTEATTKQTTASTTKETKESDD